MRRRNWKQFDPRTSRLAHEAKARKRMAEAETAVEVGLIRFSGPMLGEHVIRCLHRDGDRQVMLDVDGVPFRPATVRGVLRVLARRLTAGLTRPVPTRQGGPHTSRPYGLG